MTDENIDAAIADGAKHAEALLGEGVDPATGEGLPPEVLAKIMQAAQEAGVTGAAQAVPENNVIVKPEMYSDLVGREIVHNVIVRGQMPEGFPEFVAQFVVPIQTQVQDPASGKRQNVVQKKQLSAAIQGVKTLEDAFAKFDETAEAAAKQFINDLRSEHVRAQLASGI
jgi:hypothetical protein